MIRIPLRAVVPLSALAAALLVGTAGAQTETPPAKPAAAKAPADGNTVSGITVTPRKTCAARDRDCIVSVIAELKQKYPEQLKTFCTQWEIRTERTQVAYDQLVSEGIMLGDPKPPLPTAFGVNSAVKLACASGKAEPSKK